MKNVSKALIWFVISFIIFHAILFVMGRTSRILVFIYWHYVNSWNKLCFYQRDIASKRLLTSIGMGIITSVALIIIQLIFTYFIRIIIRIFNQRIITNGVYFKWQMLVTLLFVIPCHEYI